MTDKKFTYVGITTINGDSKVRFTDDMIRRVKQFSKNAERIDFVSLPNEMTKVEALKYMMSCKEFQSIEDQATIEETLHEKEKDFARKQPRVKMSLEDIASRKRNDVTVEDILSAID